MRIEQGHRGRKVLVAELKKPEDDVTRGPIDLGKAMAVIMRNTTK
jgi:hypothetical protein